MLEIVSLEFTDDDVTWVALNFSGAEGALGAEAIELHKWLLCFRCASEELRVIVSSLVDWVANPPPLPYPHGAYPCTFIKRH